jgi:hypothetical protein
VKDVLEKTKSSRGSLSDHSSLDLISPSVLNPKYAPSAMVVPPIGCVSVYEALCVCVSVLVLCTVCPIIFN